MIVRKVSINGIVRNSHEIATIHHINFDFDASSCRPFIRISKRVLLPSNCRRLKRPQRCERFNITISFRNTCTLNGITAYEQRSSSMPPFEDELNLRGEWVLHEWILLLLSKWKPMFSLAKQMLCIFCQSSSDEWDREAVKLESLESRHKKNSPRRFAIDASKLNNFAAIFFPREVVQPTSSPFFHFRLLIYESSSLNAINTLTLPRRFLLKRDGSKISKVCYANYSAIVRCTIVSRSSSRNRIIRLTRLSIEQ